MTLVGRSSQYCSATKHLFGLGRLSINTGDAALAIRATPLRIKSGPQSVRFKLAARIVGDIRLTAGFGRDGLGKRFVGCIDLVFFDPFKGDVLVY